MKAEAGTTDGAQVSPFAGELNAAIATRAVRIHQRLIGRGPAKAQAFVRHDAVVLVLCDALTPGERSLVERGATAAALRVRDEFNKMMRADLVQAVEELTGCAVVAYLASAHVDPDVVSQVFMLDRPVPGVAA